MFKVVVLLKRKPGLTMEQFIDYYETRHAKLGEKSLRGDALKYIRRYLSPMPHPLTGETAESEHDVVTEMWFEDHAQCLDHYKRAANSANATAIIEDEKQFLDRSRTRMFTVEERESVL